MCHKPGEFLNTECECPSGKGPNGILNGIMAAAVSAVYSIRLGRPNDTEDVLKT